MQTCPLYRRHQSKLKLTFLVLVFIVISLYKQCENIRKLANSPYLTFHDICRKDCTVATLLLPNHNRIFKACIYKGPLASQPWKCYIIVGTLALVICLICMPAALGLYVSTLCPRVCSPRESGGNYYLTLSVQLYKAFSSFKNDIRLHAWRILLNSTSM